MDDHAGVSVAPAVRRGEGGAAVPLPDRAPHLPRLQAVPEQVARGLEASDAELAEIAVRPTPPLQSVIAPELVPQQQP